MILFYYMTVMNLLQKEGFEFVTVDELIMN